MTSARTTGPGAGLLLAAVDRWAVRTPEATAVSAPDGTLSFRELADRTRGIAGALADAGVGPGVAVGLCLGRSRLSVPGLLAVWRLGGTAVPLDDRQPADQLSFVLRDSDTHVLLGDRTPPGITPHRARRIDPDTRGGPAGEPTRPHPLDCAYVIYTSGTTGWPKGVEVTYECLDTFLSALAGLALPAGGMGINAVSPAFDGWLWCLSLYLSHGQGMAIVDLVAADGPADLAGQIAATAPRTVCLTPSLLAACGDDLAGVEVLVVAGEPLPRSLVERFSRGRRMLNVYGPTETTIAATWADSERGDDLMTIGRPLPGYSTHVLDAAGHPVPPGESGELHIGGSAVARGYRNRPDLTATRFVADPFAGDGARMYRTGDLARIRPDGALEYLGRADEQVKVRGFRVELRGLEHIATTVEGVRAAAAFVVASGDALGLSVVLAPDADGDECVARIREHCDRRLPQFMVPTAVTAVLTIPTSPTGKVDRVALANTCAATLSAAGRAPRTDRERQVCEAWTVLLPNAVDDVDADFFELGGHSLLAAKAVAALRKTTGLRLTMQHLLAHPTAAHLSRELDLLAEQGAQPTAFRS